MICPSCGRTNRPGRTFCAECAAILEVRCPSCEAANEPGERYCGACAAPLTDEAATQVISRDQISVPEPTSYVGGRYEVARLLGEGSKKRVYLVHDTLLARQGYGGAGIGPALYHQGWRDIGVDVWRRRLTVALWTQITGLHCRSAFRHHGRDHVCTIPSLQRPRSRTGGIPRSLRTHVL
jgi:hypothetical protein